MPTLGIGIKLEESFTLSKLVGRSGIPQFDVKLLLLKSRTGYVGVSKSTFVPKFKA